MTGLPSRLRGGKQPGDREDQGCSGSLPDGHNRRGSLPGLEPVHLGDEDPTERKRRIVHRTAQLGVTSRILYRIEHYTSLPLVAIVVSGSLVILVTFGAGFGFPRRFVSAFEIVASALTLVMVFAIQHTQGREQAATQRKLDELLHALPGANESLMMLEEASSEVMLEVEEEQRDIRATSPTPADDEGEQRCHRSEGSRSGQSGARDD